MEKDPEFRTHRLNEVGRILRKKGSKSSVKKYGIPLNLLTSSSHFILLPLGHENNKFEFTRTKRELGSGTERISRVNCENQQRIFGHLEERQKQNLTGDYISEEVAKSEFGKGNI